MPEKGSALDFILPLLATAATAYSPRYAGPAVQAGIGTYGAVQGMRDQRRYRQMQEEQRQQQMDAVTRQEQARGRLSDYFREQSTPVENVPNVTGETFADYPEPFFTKEEGQLAALANDAGDEAGYRGIIEGAQRRRRPAEPVEGLDVDDLSTRPLPALGENDSMALTLTDNGRKLGTLNRSGAKPKEPKEPKLTRVDEYGAVSFYDEGGRRVQRHRKAEAPREPRQDRGPSSDQRSYQLSLGRLGIPTDTPIEKLTPQQHADVQDMMSATDPREVARVERKINRRLEAAGRGGAPAPAPDNGTKKGSKKNPLRYNPATGRVE